MSERVYKVDIVEQPGETIIEGIIELIRQAANMSISLSIENTVFKSLPEVFKDCKVSEDSKQVLSKILKKNLNVVYEVKLPQMNRIGEPLRIFLAKQRGDSLFVTLAEPTLPENTCQEIITKFIQAVYKKAVSKDLPKECIRFNSVGEFERYTCGYCKKPLLELSAYTCPVCNGTYCFLHRHRDKHHCKTTHRNKIHTFATVDIAKAKKYIPQCKVKIKKLFCG